MQILQLQKRFKMTRTIPAGVGGFFPVIKSLAKETSPLTALLFGVVWSYCGMKNGVCTASLETIAKEINVSKSTAFDHIKILISKGYLEDRTPDAIRRTHVLADTGKLGLEISVKVTSKDDEIDDGFITPDSEQPCSPREQPCSPREQPCSPREQPCSPREPIRLSNRLNNDKKKETASSCPPKPRVHQNPEFIKSATLIPTTAAQLKFFARLGNNFAAKGRRRPERFPTLEAKEEFRQEEARLGSGIEEAIKVGLGKGILSVTGLIDFIQAWGKGGGKVKTAIPSRFQAIARSLRSGGDDPQLPAPEEEKHGDKK
jgi:hypothetical protein